MGISETDIAVIPAFPEFRGDDADYRGLAHSGHGGKFRLECGDAGDVAEKPDKGERERATEARGGGRDASRRPHAGETRPRRG